MIGYYRNRRVSNPDFVKMMREIGLQEDLQRKGILIQTPETRDKMFISQYEIHKRKQPSYTLFLSLISVLNIGYAYTEKGKEFKQMNERSN